ncbi:MAG: secretin N-terminal domain-containing protein, partial [Sulfurospirillaceae bacterium]|nr:secretin N-terminal domain-containing protein [Sulfurospirillaceae bacterium]
MIKFIAVLTLVFTFANATCENKFFTFSVKDNQEQQVSILDVLENVTDQCKMTLLFEDEDVKKIVQKRLNYINVHEFSIRELLDLILSENNIFYSLSDNHKILKVGYIKTKSFFIDYVSFSQRKNTTNKVINTGSSGGSSSNGANGNTGSGSTKMDFTSEFKFWDKIENEITTMLQRDGDEQKNISKALINQDAGIVTVTGTKKQLERVEEYIAKMMKRLHKEILLEAKILEVTYDYDKTEGVDWSKFDFGVSAKSDGVRSRGASSSGAVTDQNYVSVADGFLNTLKNPNYLVGYSFSMDGLIKFLKTQGDVRTVSNPKVMTLNNQSAVINVGTELNYRYDTGSTTTTTTSGTKTTPSYETGSTFV